MILKNLRSIKSDSPILVSVSNKSFIGKILKKKNPIDRIYGSIVAELIAIRNGADIIRTHNVDKTKNAMAIAQKLV